MMSPEYLETTLADVVDKLKKGRFPNEQSISQGIVLRVLADLNWKVYDPEVVWPEYTTAEGGRVDFALCEPPTKPRTFIEVKQQGKAEGGVRQALEYAFHTGVPFIVLTDGRTWSFYLPAEQGSYEDRRVFMLDLFERAVSESANVLRRYLEQGQIASGKALDLAREEYRDRSRRATARKEIPDAWAGLVDSREENLVALLADAVESKAGIRPEDRDVIDFLGTLRGIIASPPPSSQITKNSTVNQNMANVSKNSGEITRSGKISRSGTMRVLGESIDYRNASEAVAVILNILQKRESDFLDRFYSHPNNNRHNRYVARSVDDLYPGSSPIRKKKSKQLESGWFLGVDYTNKTKREEILQTAAEVAGLVLGRDIDVDF